MASPRSNEPLLWMLFSAGGVMAALFLPILVLLFGVLFPVGVISPPSHAHLLVLVGHPITRAGGFLVCLLALFHWAHRFRYTLYDGLQIKHLNEVINPFCYGGAVVLSLWVAYVLWRIP